MTIVYEVRNKSNNNLAGIVIVSGGIHEATHAFIETKYPKGMPYHIAYWSDQENRSEISICGNEIEIRPVASDFEGVLV